MEHGLTPWVLGGRCVGPHPDISTVCSMGHAHRGYTTCHGGPVRLSAYITSPLVSEF